MLQSTWPKSKRERAREKNNDFTIIGSDPSSKASSSSLNVEILHRHETVNASSDDRTPATFKNRYFGIFQPLTDDTTWRRLGTQFRQSEPLIDVDILDYNNFDLAEFGFEPLDPIWLDDVDNTAPDNVSKRKRARTSAVRINYHFLVLNW